MTDDELRAHCIASKPHGHAQPADAVHDETPIDQLRHWHDEWEHKPRSGYPTHLGHAHDEFTARREGVPVL